MAPFNSTERRSVYGKRKAVSPGNVMEDFCNFSLSPATKIRRLDAEITPNFPEETPISAMACDPALFERQPQQQPGNADESKAIVLYKPIDRTIFEYPPSLKPFLTLNPDLISMIKHDQSSSYGANLQGNRKEGSMALIPWTAAPETGAITVQEEPGEAGTASMDVEEEEEGKKLFGMNAQEMNVGEDLRHWQQSCLPPQLVTPSSSIPVTWTWG